jgi:predicted small lipoprotein YifL
MLRDFAASVCARPARIAAALIVASIVIAMSGCGIKGPLRLPPPPAPPATEMGPPAPSPEPDSPSPRNP